MGARRSVASASTPPVLLPYQQRWVAEAAPVAIWEKSRRIGASWCDACCAVLTAAPENGQDALYIGYSEDMTREYLDDCAMWAKAFGHAVEWIGECVYTDEGRDIKAFRIDFASRKKVLALSSRPRSLRGKQGRVTIDEAAFHDDLPGLLKAALAMLIWGGTVRILSTHDGNANPFAELVEETRKGRLPYALHRTTFREAVADGLYERVRRILGARMKEGSEQEWVDGIYGRYRANAAEELDVIPSEGGGSYLPLALLEQRMHGTCRLVRRRFEAAFGLFPERQRAAEVLLWCEETLGEATLALDHERWHAFGLDFGRISDLTVLTVLEEGKDLVRRCRLVVELGNCPFRQQEQVVAYVGDRLPRLRCGALDAGGNGAALAEYAADRYGAGRIEQIKLSEAFYLSEMPRFKGALEDGTLDGLPRDDACRDDLRAIRRINGVPKLPAVATLKAEAARTLDGEGKQDPRHGDFAISLFLADYALRRDLLPGRCDGYEAIPRHGSAAGGESAWWHAPSVASDSRRCI